MKQPSPVIVILLVVASAGITDGFIFPEDSHFVQDSRFVLLLDLLHLHQPPSLLQPTPLGLHPHLNPDLFVSTPAGLDACSFVLTYVFGRGWTRRFRCIPLCGLRCLRGKRSTTDKDMVYILY